LLRKQASGGIVLFKSCGIDFPEAAVPKRDVQPLIDERLEGDVAKPQITAGIWSSGWYSQTSNRDIQRHWLWSVWRKFEARDG
jgi:hypothetical protein